MTAEPIRRTRKGGPTPLVAVALAANFVIVAIAAIVAIVVLVYNVL
jgi:hypothetical protein